MATFCTVYSHGLSSVNLQRGTDGQTHRVNDIHTHKREIWWKFGVSCFSYKDTSTIRSESHLKTSFNLNYLLEGPISNTVMLGMRASANLEWSWEANNLAYNSRQEKCFLSPILERHHSKPSSGCTSPQTLMKNLQDHGIKPTQSCCSTF